MTNDEARALLIRTLDEVAGILDRGDVAPRLSAGENVRIDEIGIDSLATIEWGMAIERETDIEIETTELKAFSTLDELAVHLAQRTS